MEIFRRLSLWLEFVDSGSYFVQNEIIFIYPLKKVTDPDPAAQKSTDPTGSGSSSLIFTEQT